MIPNDLKEKPSLLAFTCSKLTEALEKGVKYVQG